MAGFDRTRYIPLSNSESAMVDEEDYDAISSVDWRINQSRSKRYAVKRGSGGKTVFMHRMIMSPSDDMVVDHVNGDTLDNRKSNLRICTKAENLRNAKTRKHSKTGIKGVAFASSRAGTKRYRARIRVDNVRLSLGTYGTKEEAMSAYRLAASKLHGEFARFG